MYGKLLPPPNWCYYFCDEKGIDTRSQTSLKTSQKGGCTPLNPPPGSPSAFPKYFELPCWFKSQAITERQKFFQAHYIVFMPKSSSRQINDELSDSKYK